MSLATRSYRAYNGCRETACIVYYWICFWGNFPLSFLQKHLLQLQYNEFILFLQHKTIKNAFEELNSVSQAKYIGCLQDYAQTAATDKLSTVGSVKLYTK